MRTFAKSQIRYSKSQRMGIFAFLGILIGLQFLIFYLSQTNSDVQIIEVPEEVLLLDKQLGNTQQTAQNVELKNFDPNELSPDEWQNLGFSEKQVKTILKYKFSLGGYFSSKEQIQECFVISAKKFNEIEPYIVFGDLNSYKNKPQNRNYDHANYSENSKPKVHYQRFNPNDYSAKDWERIGFSPNQAETILKYKMRLGGQFTSLEQIQKCFVISEEKFREMEPYIYFPIKKSKGTIEVLEEEEIKPIKTSSIQLIEEISEEESSVD